MRNKRIHVLTLTSFYPSRKDERNGFVAEPLAEFEGLRLDSSVIAARPWYESRMQPSVIVSPASWVRYPVLPGNRGLSFSGQALYLRARGMVRRLHRKHHIDILHAHAPLPSGEAARLLSVELGIPFLITVHGLDAYLTEQVGGRAGERCEALCRRVYETTARVICISEQVRNRVLDRLPGLKSAEVIHNGVDTQNFSPAECSPLAAQSIVSVGNLIQIKGHDVTLRAVAELHKEFPELRCRIVGEGVELGRLRGLAQELDISQSVEFLGRKTRVEISQVLRESSIFVLPSRYEGLGCVYLEAMSSGIPAIACRGQGIADVIRDGENGFLVAQNSPRELAEAIRKLIVNSELRQRIGVAARRTILEGFTLFHQAQHLHAVYESCLA